MTQIDLLIRILIRIERGEDPEIPYQLHRGLRKCIAAMGGASGFREFLELIRDAEL